MRGFLSFILDTLSPALCVHCGAELEEGFEDDEKETKKEKASPGVERAAFCGESGEPIDEEDDECPSCGVDLCPDCGNPLDEDDEVCPHCGAEFAFSCPDCGEDLPVEAEACPHCGYEFEEEGEDG